jgi:hypothetical protein
MVLHRPVELAAETGQVESTENQIFGNATYQDLSDFWISLSQRCVCFHANERNHPNQNAGLNEVRVAAKHFGNRCCRCTNEQEEQEQNPPCPFTAYVLFRADALV